MTSLASYLRFVAIAIVTVGCESGDPVSLAGEQGQIQRVVGDLTAVALPNGTATVFAPATGTVRVPDSVRVVLNNLAPLAGGAVYKTWLVRPDSVGNGVVFPIEGRYVRRVSAITYDASGAVAGPLVIADSLAAPVSSFVGGPGTITFTTRSYASTGATVADTAYMFLISIEDSPSATTPSARQPFWIRVVRRSTDANNGGGNLAFGTFRFRNGLAAPVPFVPQGRVNGGVLGDSIRIVYPDTLKKTNGTDSIIVQKTGYQFVGSVLQLNLQGLQRPPRGYRYVAYICRSGDDNCAPTDSSTRYLSAGTLTTLDGQSLADADVASESSTLTATRINTAMLTYRLTAPGETFCRFDRVLLALEPKSAVASLPLGITFSGQTPELIRKARSCA